jgi:hypothetical protein
MIFINMEENEDLKTRYCNKCIHFDADNKACTAFPSGIPSEILSGKIQHKSKFPEQQGTDVFVNAREYFENEGLVFHTTFGNDDFIVE